MSILLSVQNLSKSFGSRDLFKGLSFTLSSSDRIGLIGPNGAGKSTLLRCLCDLETPDDGTITSSRGLKIGYLPQTPLFEPNETVEHYLLKPFAHHPPVDRAMEWMSRLNLSAETETQKLSGGWQKRVALARELIKEPDLLLLDEPTNHLDVEGILWLEEFLQSTPMALLMVTHDRLFLQRTTDRIIEINPRFNNGMFDFKGSYSDYLEARMEYVSSQSRLEDTMRNRLRRETEWLRRGAKARQTKQKARIERAGELADTTQTLKTQNAQRTSKIEFQERERNPKKLIEAQQICIQRNDTTLFVDLNLLITPKTRLALLGTNGCGKSTLIQILLKTLEPTSGSVWQADDLKIAWFEQDKSTLNNSDHVIQAVCPQGDYVEFQGRPVFARAYLNRFLFRAEQLDMPIAQLSGGEKSRLRIAQLMLKPANVLVLDEPTNDLDSDTLDVLAQSLSEFNGAVILVTHDRFFMDQVTNQILAFPVVPDTTDPELIQFASYDQWESWRDEQLSRRNETARKAKNSDSSPAKRKISYKEKFEWEQMERTVLAKEKELESLQAQANAPEAQKDREELSRLFKQISTLQEEIERLYARWAELERLLK